MRDRATAIRGGFFGQGPTTNTFFIVQLLLYTDICVDSVQQGSIAGYWSVCVKKLGRNRGGGDMP